MVAAAYGVQAVLRLRGEESALRAEPVLATSVSRSAWFTSHLLVALATSAALMLAMGLFVGLAHGARHRGRARHDGHHGGCGLARVPAVWAVTGLAAAIFGLLPRATVVAWVALVAFLVVGELGPLVRLPGWVMDTSPFAHVPSLPGGAMAWAPWWPAAVAALLLAVGMAGSSAGTSADPRPRVSACPSPRTSRRALADAPGVQWSVRAVDVATGRELCSHDAAAVLPTASVGKVLLLVETARQLEAGELDPALAAAADWPRTPYRTPASGSSWPRTGSASTTWPCSSAS